MSVRALGILFLVASTAGASVEQDAVSLLVSALQDPDRGVRYAAAQALGKARAGLPRLLLSLEDPEWCVRQAAGRALVGFGDAAVPKIVRVYHAGSPKARVEAVEALGRIGGTGIPWLVAALDEPDPRLVIEALDGLGRLGAAPVRRLVELLHDKNLEVRLLAAIQLKRAAPDHAPLADRTLTEVMIRSEGRRHDWAKASLGGSPEETPERKPADTSGDPDPPFTVPALPAVEVGGFQARLRAVRSATTGAAALAPLLRHANPVMSRAAARALMRMGEEAALPAARQVATGHLGVLQYAPEIFEALGADGGPAVEALARLLTAPNVHIRETAARCLAAIGPLAEPASGALVAALADRRLPVVSHAALALGAIGITPALIEGLRSERARVRAYSAFAAGWAYGVVHGIDQVVYEPRLPVVDCGEPGPFPNREQVAGLSELPAVEARRLARTGLGSPDPEIAIPCAAVFEYDQLDAWEMERCVELLIPAGFRPGSAAEFEKVRGYLGSSELPALLEYARYPYETEPERDHLYGALHRSARAENIPALLWLERHESARVLDGIYSLWQPVWRTMRFRDLLLGDAGSVAGLIERDLPFSWWWLEDRPLTNEEAGWILRLAGETGSWGALKALGRARDAGSRRYLRHIATEGDEGANFALASLARRGFADATTLLVKHSREDDEALGLLLEARPDVGRAELIARLQESGSAAYTADLLGDAANQTYYYGLVWRSDLFEGIEPLLPVERLDAAALRAIAASVPGCRTHRVAEALYKRLERETGSPWPGWTVADLLYLHDPQRLLPQLRRWAQAEDEYEARLALARVGEPEDGGNALGQLDEWELDWVRRYPGLEIPADNRDARLAMQGLPYPLAADEPSDAERLRFDEQLQRGEGSRALRELLENHPDLYWWRNPVVRKRWMLDHLRGCLELRDRVSSAHVLPLLAAWPEPQARLDHWSILRAGRHFWIYSNEDEELLTLGFDASTLPFWIEELESNCCRIAGGPEDIWENRLGLDVVWGCHNSGVGEPPVRRVHQWFQRNGGEMVWSPLSRRWVAKPEPGGATAER